MQKKTIKDLVLENIGLLIPFILYALYKNGYLIYARGLINLVALFKPVYLIIISIIIKIVINLILYKKIKIDYDFLSLILIAMIMPYNINIIVYIITLSLSYLALLFLNKYIKCNKICAIYLIIILVNSFFREFTFLNPLEAHYNFSFSFLDLLTGRNIGSISTTNILFSLIAYSILTFNFYYKKDIPFMINITYLILALSYFLITKDNTLILNSELIFASIFVSTIPMNSPYKRIYQILYGIFIGLLTFIIALLFNKVVAVYIAILIASLINNWELKKKLKEK